MASTPPPVSGNTANITVTLAANGVAVFDTTIANISLTTANVANLNVTGVISSNASPLTNTATRVLTGLCAFMKANTSRASVGSPTTEANLTITVNETGTYRYEAGFFVFATANGAGSFQFNINGGGSGSINTGAIAILTTNNRGMLVASGDQYAQWVQVAF